MGLIVENQDLTPCSGRDPVLGAGRYTRMMRMRPLLAVALLALGSSSLALSQQGLPGDWEKKVAAVVPEA